MCEQAGKRVLVRLMWRYLPPAAAGARRQQQRCARKEVCGTELQPSRRRCKAKGRSATGEWWLGERVMPPGPHETLWRAATDLPSPLPFTPPPTGPCPACSKAFLIEYEQGLRLVVLTAALRYPDIYLITNGGCGCSRASR